jgi:hypothetical protein
LEITPPFALGEIMAKVVWIDAEHQRIEVKETNGLDDLQALVGGMVEPVHYVKMGHRDLLCVNEEGLYQGYAYGFQLDGYQFVGNGFIGTLEKGDVRYDPAGLVGRLAFLKKKEMPDPQDE